MRKRILIINSGGDCPGMNAVIRAIVKRADQEDQSEMEWELIGSVNAFDGILSEPLELVPLTNKTVEGIHIKGGTILMTNNKRNPFHYPVKQEDGSTKYTDVSDTLIYNLKVHGFDAVIHIGGNESHKISQKLFEKGIHIIGIPKTINNDLSITDYTFGFQSAVQTATEAVDKLVTTAASHNRVIILEVMGRDAGWIALHSAIAGGAEVCLIPEIPFSMDIVLKKLKSRYDRKGRGFVNIVVAEGAYPIGGASENIPGSISRRISKYLKKMNFDADVRETILGHLQRGGSPMAFDRILATELGVKAFELVKDKIFGVMAVHHNSQVTYIDIEKVIDKYNKVDLSSDLIQTARGIGVCFGDE